MADDLVVVLDCGATNARAIAVNAAGGIESAAGRPNEPAPQPDGDPEWLVWPLQGVFDRLAEACREALTGVDASRVKAVTVTTFGADGAPVAEDGTLTYPVISWQDPRTEPIARNIASYMDPWQIFSRTGYQVIPFNTLLKLIWLRENAPEALEPAGCWMMMPGLLSFLLSGERSIDPTAAGTMMAMDAASRSWSDEMLALADLDAAFFPRWVEPGGVIGSVTDRAAEATGLPAGIPVVAAGHDTQFAAVGSGAGPSEAIVSSGTWEIAMLRQDRYEATRQGFEEGLIIEADAEPGRWNPQLLMMGSGVLEWIREGFYGEIGERSAAYPAMIADAEKLSPGAGGVTVLTSFVPDTGPTAKYRTQGTILGLGINTERGQVYRAGLEGLCLQLRYALEILAGCTGFRAEGIRVVGGGAKNRLWNQLRADVTDMPVTTIANEEATVLGAAIFAFIGAGLFASVEDGQARADLGERTVAPCSDRLCYDDLYQAYRESLPVLSEFYGR
ncbi:MAG TPA: FGGY family carbohydrate kinase [Armatimonadota bacterium]|nr:FGGY family carbohydrate kinase [Armatimonadota bacterium]